MYGFTVPIFCPLSSNVQFLQGNLRQNPGGRLRHQQRGERDQDWSPAHLWRCQSACRRPGLRRLRRLLLKIPFLGRYGTRKSKRVYGTSSRLINKKCLLKKSIGARQLSAAPPCICCFSWLPYVLVWM